MERPAPDLAPSSIPEPEPLVLHEPPPRPSKVLLVAFAGFHMEFGGIPSFQFLRMLREFPCRKTFLRDPTPRWYLGGLAGIGPSVEDVAAHLRAHIRDCGAERVVVLGNSSGAYAALLFGALLDADEVHAFGPKTRLSRPEDFRDQSRFQDLHARIPPGNPWLDLPDLLAKRAGGKSAFHVHFGRDHALDARQARLLDGLPGVRLHAYPTAGHGLVQELKHLGRLAPILECAVEGRTMALGWAIRRAAWHMGLRRWRAGRRGTRPVAAGEGEGEA